MDHPRILLLDRDNIGHDIDYGPLEKLGNLSILDHVEAADIEAEILRHRADTVVANRPVFPAGLLENPGPLSLICLTATGTNTVDLAAARKGRVAVCNIVGYSTDSVAQHTFALALAILDRIQSFRNMAATWHGRRKTDPKAGAWTDLRLPYSELAGKTWGIVGMGAIGRKVAGIAEAFGCKVQWASASESQRTERWPRVDIRSLMAKSDVISIHSPIHDKSRGLVGYDLLRTMKATGVLINVGRGGIVDEAGLARILDEERILGAGIDVLWPEPPLEDNPLLSLKHPERLILTPHVAWAAVEARQRAIAECALNIESFLKGEKRNRVD